MMFSAKFITFAIAALAAPSVLAAPAAAGGGGGGGQCNTGPVQCCNSVQNAGSSPVSGLLGLLGVVLGANVPVGLTCSPLTLIGVSGSSCSSQPVCCSDNSFNGIIALGCTPINIGL